MTCADPATCGQPQYGSGHPKSGWIKTHTAGRHAPPDRWWCSTQCLVASLLHTDPHTGRSDVANCAHCVNRHDRDHACPVCRSTPQVQGVPVAAVHLYDHARQSIQHGTEATE